MDRDIEQAGTAIVECVRSLPGRRMRGTLWAVELYVDPIWPDIVESCWMVEGTGWNLSLVNRYFRPANAAARTLWRVNNWKLADAGGRKR